MREVKSAENRAWQGVFEGWRAEGRWMQSFNPPEAEPNSISSQTAAQLTYWCTTGYSSGSSS